jgi:hypothetical protein
MSGKHLSVGIAGDRSEEPDRDLESAERDRRVQRSAAGHRSRFPAVIDGIDERLAPDDDHDVVDLGVISPEPRGIRVTGMTVLTAGALSPSSRRKS